ncbi:uncharacterized protein LOC127736534 isoform X2 [Mytilus californianus]|nr:uncharacterized protein LOC127736534 isoform X2 [Mytilus californianus]
MKAYLQDVRPLNSSFSLHASANLFLNCVYATRNETQQHCLFKYSVETGTEITVFTRPRGMIKRSRSFCYNAQSQHVYEFGVLEQTSSDNTGKTSNSMFVLTDNKDSPASGITCFGQDISASTETVAIMICVRLPGLYKNIIESSEVSTWTCPQQKQPTSHKTSISRPNDNTVSSPLVSAGHLTSNEIQSEKTEDIEHENAEHDPREKQYTKFCDLHDCSMPNENLNIYSEVEKNIQSKPFQKSEKVSKSFDDMVTDIQMHETMKMPSKLKKEQKIPKRPSIQLRYSDDETMMNKYLLKTEQAVLGLFCNGCTFCQKAKNEILYLGQKLVLSALDIVIVDINNKYLPSHLEVPWTPFIRYKRQGTLSSWIDSVENRYDKMSVMKFLHESVTTDTRNTTVHQTVDNQPTRRRKRRSSIEISKDGCAKQEPSSSPHKSMCPVEKGRYDCYGNVMRLKPKGRRSKTNSNEWDKTKSQEAVKQDYMEILKRMDCYKKAGACNCISPAVIAAIASRESRAGKLLYKTKGYGDNNNAFGIMQCDLRYHKTCKAHAWDSCGHINAMVEDVLISYIKEVQTKQPKWVKERQLQGGVAAYNFGVSNVQTWKNVDLNTTNHDYSNDVIARAQWLINNNPDLWKN